MSQLTPDEAAATANEIRTEIGRVIVGQRELVHSVLLALLCEGHLLIEGVPGLGKTQLLKTLADAVDLPWSRIQFTPDLMPADIVGTEILNQRTDGTRELTYRPGPIMTNLVLADEVNRATPKTQSAMLEAMGERSVTVAGQTRHLDRPFLVMATQNPVESEGTYPLPEAQLDRFLFKLLVDMPDSDDLFAIIGRTTGVTVAKANAVCDVERLHAMIEVTRSLPIPDVAVRHAIELVLAGHPNGPASTDAISRYVRFGPSPRGVQALVLAAKANALLDGRPSASSDDVRSVAVDSLRHRLVVGYEAVADGVSTDSLVAGILDQVAPPSAGIRGAP